MLGSVSLVNVPTCMVVPGAYAADRYAGRSGAARTLGTPSRGTVSTSVHAPGSPTVIVPVSSVHVTKPSGSARASSERADSARGCWAAAVAEDPAASTTSGRLSAATTRFVILMSILVVLVGRRLGRRRRSRWCRMGRSSGAKGGAGCRRCRHRPGDLGGKQGCSVHHGPAGGDLVHDAVATVVVGALGPPVWSSAAESNVARIPSTNGNSSGLVTLIRNTAVNARSGGSATITWYSPRPVLPQPV